MVVSILGYALYFRPHHISNLIYALVCSQALQIKVVATYGRGPLLLSLFFFFPAPKAKAAFQFGLEKGKLLLQHQLYQLIMLLNITRLESINFWYPLITKIVFLYQSTLQTLLNVPHIQLFTDFFFLDISKNLY